MKRRTQIALPFGALRGYVDAVPGDAVYHLRPVGGLVAFCGRVLGETAPRPGRRQEGWGRIGEPLRCAACARHLAKLRAAR
jgi:hypothetical protein